MTDVIVMIAFIGMGLGRGDVDLHGMPDPIKFKCFNRFANGSWLMTHDVMDLGKFMMMMMLIMMMIR